MRLSTLRAGRTVSIIEAIELDHGEPAATARAVGVRRMVGGHSSGLSYPSCIPPVRAVGVGHWCGTGRAGRHGWGHRPTPDESLHAPVTHAVVRGVGRR
jgi:hypothetical protein